LFLGEGRGRVGIRGWEEEREGKAGKYRRGKVRGREERVPQGLVHIPMFEMLKNILSTPSRRLRRVVPHRNEILDTRLL